MGKAERGYVRNSPAKLRDHSRPIRTIVLVGCASNFGRSHHHAVMSTVASFIEYPFKNSQILINDIIIC